MEFLTPRFRGRQVWGRRQEPDLANPCRQNSVRHPTIYFSKKNFEEIVQKQILYSVSDTEVDPLCEDGEDHEVYAPRLDAEHGPEPPDHRENITTTPDTTTDSTRSAHNPTKTRSRSSTIIPRRRPRKRDHGVLPALRQGSRRQGQSGGVHPVRRRALRQRAEVGSVRRAAELSGNEQKTDL